jgi:hypothetical protein
MTCLLRGMFATVELRYYSHSLYRRHCKLCSPTDTRRFGAGPAFGDPSAAPRNDFAVRCTVDDNNNDDLVCCWLLASIESSCLDAATITTYLKDRSNTALFS